MLVVLLAMGTVLLAYANGSNDNFKATATMYGSGTLRYRGALGLATVAQVAGSLGSVLLAGALLQAFGGKGLVPDAVVADPRFLVSVAVGAGVTVLGATRAGIPVSTTHALIGGLVGAGFASAGAGVHWGALGAKYFLPLAASPLLALAGSASLYPLARYARRRMGVEAGSCLCLEPSAQAVAATPGGTLLVSSATVLRVGHVPTCPQTAAGSLAGLSARRVVDVAHGVSAAALGFARGLNDTPKVLGLLVASGWSGIEPRISLVVVASAMAVGGLLHSRRVADTLGHRITTMDAGQGLVANGVSSVLVIGASLMGSPVSTTHVATGSLFGLGLWTGRADWRVVGGIVAAWITTLPVAALLSASCVALLSRW